MYRYAAMVQENSGDAYKLFENTEQTFEIVVRNAFEGTAEDVIAVSPRPLVHKCGDHFVRYNSQMPVDVYSYE